MRKNYSLYKNDPIPRQEIHHPGTSGNQVQSNKTFHKKINILVLKGLLV